MNMMIVLIVLLGLAMTIADRLPMDDEKEKA